MGTCHHPTVPRQDRETVLPEAHGAEGMPQCPPKTPVRRQGAGKKYCDRSLLPASDLLLGLLIGQTHPEGSDRGDWVMQP